MLLRPLAERHRLAFLASLLAFCCALPAAARPLAERPGWGADLAVAAALAEGRSQFDGESENAVTADLDNPGKRVSDAQPFALARIDYTLSSLRTQYYVGTSQENVSKGQFQIEFGVVHDAPGLGRMTAAYFPELPFLGDTWADPYLAGAPRTRTEEQGQGGRLALQGVAGTGLGIQYAYAVNRIDEERAGEGLGLSPAERALLDRDADLDRLTLEYRVVLGRALVFTPAVFYTRVRADGDADSSDEVALRLQGSYRTGRHRLSGSFVYAALEAEVDHPVFGRRQEDDRYSLFALYSYAEPFGWRDWGLLAIAFAGRTDSSIGFFERESLGLGLGFSYRWR
jgi:hypothetical protein